MTTTRRTVRRALLGAGLCLALGPVFWGAASRAAPTPPDAGTLLFEEPQLAQTAPGDVLSYSYSRKTADDTQFGLSFQDSIRLTIDAGSSAETRTVRVQLFTGANRRAAGPFQDMTGNPLLSLFLENHVALLAAQFQANPRYLKTAIRTALRERAEVEPAEVAAGGRNISGWRVRIEPFKDDPNKARMRGLEGMAYEFAVAKDIPGEVAEIHVVAPGPSGPLLDEKVNFDGKSR